MPIGSAVANLRNELSSRTETLHSRESLLNYLFKHQHRSQFFKSHAIISLAYTFLRNSETPNLINSTTLSRRRQSFPLPITRAPLQFDRRQGLGNRELACLPVCLCSRLLWAAATYIRCATLHGQSLPLGHICDRSPPPGRAATVAV
jgi:hypothetical protein